VGGIENVLRGKDGQILGLGRARRGAPRFPSVDQAEPTRSATASTAATRQQRSGGRGGGIKAASKLFWQAFPNLGQFCPRISKALAVLWDSKGLQGSKPKRSNLQIFRRAGLVSARCRRRRDPTHYPPRARGGVLRCDPVDDGGRPRPLHAELKRASGSSRSAAAIVTLPALIVSFSLGERGEGKNRGASRSDTAA